ncbi:hypothetical protein [Hymenobacter chitinivorans]|nr:hypothetical protein [Hymenobacter chitinivorans]
MSCVVDSNSGKVLAFYTTNSAYNPNQINLRHAKLLQTLDGAVAAQPWIAGPLTDVAVILEDEMHHLRPLNGGKWYCFLAVRLADANLGITKEIMRRHSF